MSNCVNHIGGGAVYVAAEVTPGISVAFQAAQFLPHCHAVTMPAINAETVENGAIRADRGQNTPFQGNPSELAWSLQIVMPEHPAVIAPVAALFAAAGIGANGQPIAGAICDKTLQIARIDRDSNLIEILNGCIVSSFDISAAPNDEFYCTFNGTAKRKTELAARDTFAGIEDSWSEQTAYIDGCHHDSMSVCYRDDSDFSFGGGITGWLYDQDGEAYPCSFTYDTEQHMLAAEISDSEADSGFSVTRIKFKLPAPSATDYFTFKSQFAGIAFGANNAILQGVSAFNLTCNTGLSYVALGVTDKLPANIQSGAAELSGSFSVILNQNFEAYKAAYFVGPATNQITLTGEQYSITLTSVSMSDFPAYELASDALATGSISFRVNNLGFDWSQN